MAQDHFYIVSWYSMYIDLIFQQSKEDLLILNNLCSHINPPNYLVKNQHDFKNLIKKGDHYILSLSSIYFLAKYESKTFLLQISKEHKDTKYITNNIIYKKVMYFLKKISYIISMYLQVSLLHLHLITQHMIMINLHKQKRRRRSGGFFVLENFLEAQLLYTTLHF